MAGYYPRWIEMPDGTEQFSLGYDLGADEDGYNPRFDDVEGEQNEIEDDL